MVVPGEMDVGFHSQIFSHIAAGDLCSGVHDLCHKHTFHDPGTHAVLVLGSSGTTATQHLTHSSACVKLVLVALPLEQRSATDHWVVATNSALGEGALRKALLDVLVVL